VTDLSGRVFTYASAYYVDTTAPSAPASLSAADAVGKIILTWTASPSTDVIGYEIYEAASEADLNTMTSPSRTVGLVTAAEFDSGVGAAKYYKLRAYDSAGNKSGFTEIKSAAANNDTTAPEMKSISPGTGMPAAKIYISLYTRAG
jgi:hypothetical protein